MAEMPWGEVAQTQKLVIQLLEGNDLDHCPAARAGQDQGWMQLSLQFLRQRQD
jgi:hypothetical protein